MGITPGGRGASNIVVLGIFGFLFLVGALIVVGFLGVFLLPLALVFLFLLAVYFTRGYGFTGTTIILGILLFFMIGVGIHFVLGSTIGYVDQSAVTSTLATVKLDTIGSSISDSAFSAVLGFIVIIVIVVLAFFGLFVSSKHR